MAVTKQVKKQFLISTTKRRLLLYISALLASYLLYYLIDPFSEIWTFYLNNPLGEGLTSLLWMSVFSILTVEICLFVDDKLSRILPLERGARKRFIVQTLLQVVASVVIILLFNILFTMLYNRVMNKDYPSIITWFAQSIANTILVSLLISSIHSIDSLLENWKKTTLEAAELKLQQSELRHATTVAELQALKLQLDPHFIFNNLSALSETILADQQAGYEYAEHFAEVYRYLLLNSNKNTIALKEELDFLDAYIYMIQQRLGTGVSIIYDIEKSVLTKTIPPLTLQLLVENAIKHNQTAKATPLIIEIIADSPMLLRISNNLIPLVNKPSTAGLGLPNIIKRFELLNLPTPKIEITPSKYTVIIPLV
ncbi:sensor histidine kinase [Sphingobacterium sp. MYb382]|uniref:sensor histidine kinase n=1 Tax=Sphingobacterium sp. MYb382 TaxID=2745278 RepID=UPI0030EC0EDC